VGGEARAGAVEQAHHDLGVDEVFGQPKEIKPTVGAWVGSFWSQFYCTGDGNAALDSITCRFLVISERMRYSVCSV